MLQRADELVNEYYMLRKQTKKLRMFELLEQLCVQISKQQMLSLYTNLQWIILGAKHKVNAFKLKQECNKKQQYLLKWYTYYKKVQGLQIKYYKIKQIRKRKWFNRLRKQQEIKTTDSSTIHSKEDLQTPKLTNYPMKQQDNKIQNIIEGRNYLVLRKAFYYLYKYKHSNESDKPIDVEQEALQKLKQWLNT